MFQQLFYLVLAAAMAATSEATSHGSYLLGTGIADVTGPAADVNMMGYAMPQQTVAGLHTRLWARAFIVADPSDIRKRFVFVNLDACMASQAVTLAVHKKLQEEFGDLYGEQNVAISGIHTHSGPAGYLQYLLYDITSLGFVRESFDALVDGIVLAVTRAHRSVRPGTLAVARGELLNANTNRSPTAYLANPASERARFKHDVDKDMTLLRFDSANSGKSIGALTWFPVHCTSINNTNRLISGDNKGAASQMFERHAHRDAGHGSRLASVSASACSADGRDGSSSDFDPAFLAAFGQANVGDTSPNVLGAFCQDTGLPCDPDHSTCDGRTEMCIGRGPAYPDYFASNEIIARRQFERALSLWNESSSTPVKGGISYRHAYLDMSNTQVEESTWTRAGRTCHASMGFAFAAGTTDGPGAFDFTQGDLNGTTFWRLVRDFLHVPSEQQKACQAPKPILLDTGAVTLPYAWQPAIVEISILRVGQVVVLCVPGEFTTMAGRRLRAAVKEAVAETWGPDVELVIAGLTNTYSSYVTTFEEYGVQRYEGASTIYGPHTLDAYIQEFRKLAEAMVDGRTTPPGPLPPNLVPKQWSLLPPVVIDSTPFGGAFGKVVVEPPPGPWHTNQTVSATFQSACPRNSLGRRGSFLTVERKADGVGGGWEIVHTDNDMSTKFEWGRPHVLSSESTAVVSWRIPPDAQPGTYRLQHFGDSKGILGGFTPFSGATGSFQVGPPVPPTSRRSGQQWSAAMGGWEWSRLAARTVLRTCGLGSFWGLPV
mmetsp:Transcript_14122/g.42621  ORF Transcript_14122/g.42621 Transcript_14122/m.42621 type:complete len:771 (+) Transcript_14122:129-2441(+)